jgi:2-oxoglutarate dehydrogenase E2 component (dihydrolipoamide succinyltransferase)
MNRAHVGDPNAAPAAAAPAPRAPAAPTAPPPGAPAAPAGAPAPDANRFSLLKKPPADRPDPLAALRAFQSGAGQR